MKKEYLGEESIARLIKLIKAEFEKYVRRDDPSIKQDLVIISDTEPVDAPIGTIWLDTSEATIAYAKGVGF